MKETPLRFHALGMVALVSICGGVAAKADTVIEPLGAATRAEVNLSAIFERPRGVIKEIHIEVWAGPIGSAEHGDQLPVGIPKRKSAVHHAFLCDAAAELSSGRCVRRLADVAVGNHPDLLVSVVTWYVARGEELYKDRIREQAMEESIGFAVGSPLGYPDLAWPLIWHEAYPLAKKLDLAFTYPEALFRPVQRVREIQRLTFESKNAYAGLLAGRKELFNLWLLAPVRTGFYNPALPCDFDLPDPALKASHFMDGIVLVHEGPVADCGYVTSGFGGNGLNGKGSVRARWSSEREELATPSGLTLTHEIGHFLFEQSDEYEQLGGYVPAAACANVRLRESECQADLRRSGISKAQGVCREFQGSGLNPRLWRSFLAGAGGKEIMDLGPLVSPSLALDWGATSRKCIEDRLDGTVAFRSTTPMGGGPNFPAKARALSADGDAVREPPRVPKGRPGVITYARTCRMEKGIWFVPESGGRRRGTPGTMELEAICPTAPESLPTSCSPGASRLKGEEVWIAEAMKVGDRDAPGEIGRCWELYEVIDSVARRSAYSGSCVPRVAVEGMGLIDEPEGLLLVIALESDPERRVESLCLSSPLNSADRPPAYIF